jgi:hypothetical protein
MSGLPIFDDVHRYEEAIARLAGWVGRRYRDHSAGPGFRRSPPRSWRILGRDDARKYLSAPLVRPRFSPIAPQFQDASDHSVMPGRLTACSLETIMKMLVVALGLAGLLAAPVLAAEMNFAVVDADGSGLVSIEETTAAGWEWTEEQFAAADSDGDGYLNVEEFAAAAAKG